MDLLRSSLTLDISPVVSALRELLERIDKQDKKIEEQRQMIEASKDFQTSTRQLVQQFKSALDQLASRVNAFEDDLPGKVKVLREDLSELQIRHSDLLARLDAQADIVNEVKCASETAYAKAEDTLAAIPRLIQSETSAFADKFKEDQEIKFQQMTDIINARQELVFDRVRAIETTVQNLPDQELFDAAAQNTVELEGIVRKAMGDITKLQLGASREQERVSQLEDAVQKLKHTVSSRGVLLASVGESSTGTPRVAPHSAHHTQEEMERDRILAQFDLSDPLLMSADARRERAAKTQALVAAGVLPKEAASQSMPAHSPSASSRNLLDAAHAPTPDGQPSDASKAGAVVVAGPAGAATTGTAAGLDWVAARELDAQNTAKRIRELEDRLLEQLVEQRAELDSEIRTENARMQQRFAGLARVIKGLHARVTDLDSKRFSGIGMQLIDARASVSTPAGPPGSASSALNDMVKDLDALVVSSRDSITRHASSVGLDPRSPGMASPAPQSGSTPQQQLGSTSSGAGAILLPPIHGTQNPPPSTSADTPTSARTTDPQLPVPPPVRQLGYQPPAGLKGLAARRVTMHNANRASIATTALESPRSAGAVSTPNEQMYEQQLVQGLASVAAREAELIQQAAGNVDSQLLKRYIDVGLKEVNEKLRRLEHNLPIISAGGKTLSMNDLSAGEVLAASQRYTDSWISYFNDRLTAIDADLAAFGVQLPSLDQMHHPPIPQTTATHSGAESHAPALKSSMSTHSLNSNVTASTDASSSMPTTREYRLLLGKLRKELGSMIQKARLELAAAVLGPNAARIMAEPSLAQQRGYTQLYLSGQKNPDDDNASEPEDHEGEDPKDGTKSSPKRVKSQKLSPSRSRSRSPQLASRGTQSTANLLAEGSSPQNQQQPQLVTSSSTSQLVVAPAPSRTVPHFAASGLVVHKGPTQPLVGEDGKLYKGRQADAVIFSPPSNSVSGQFFTAVTNTPPSSPRADGPQSPARDVSSGTPTVMGTSIARNASTYIAGNESGNEPEAKLQATEEPETSHPSHDQASGSSIGGPLVGKQLSAPHSTRTKRPTGLHQVHHRGATKSSIEGGVKPAQEEIMQPGPKALAMSLSTSGLLSGLTKR